MALASVHQTNSQPRMLFPRLGIEAAGILTLLLGAWAGILPFVGATFGFSADGTGSWHWNQAHALLFLAPGAAAFVAGIVALASAARVRPATLAMAGVLAAVCGAWLVVGPVAWPVLHGTGFFHSGASPIRELAFWIGYALGPGGLLLALGAFILGRDRFHPVEAP